MATSKRKPTKWVEETIEEAKPVEAPAPAEPTIRKPSPEQVAAAQSMLDTIRQNAMATRDPLYWGQYRGACEMVQCLGYTITVVNERVHVLNESD